MHSLEGTIKLNSPEVSKQIHANARALNLGASNPGSPKSGEKTGQNDRREYLRAMGFTFPGISKRCPTLDQNGGLTIFES